MSKKNSSVKKHSIKEITDKPTVSKAFHETEDIPVFCFKYLSEVSIKGSTDYKFFYGFLLRLKMLSDAGWKEIRKSNRHGIGVEKIPIHKIKPELPTCVTPEITELTVFRANGDNRPFLGIQERNAFRVLFIETKFGDIYDHS